MACFFEHAIQFGLHIFPEGVSGGFDHHASAYWGVFSQLGFFNDVEVPLGVVGVARGDILSHKGTEMLVLEMKKILKDTILFTKVLSLESVQ